MLRGRWLGSGWDEASNEAGRDYAIDADIDPWDRLRYPHAYNDLPILRLMRMGLSGLCHLSAGGILKHGSKGGMWSW
jgi:hypothetical protein